MVSMRFRAWPYQHPISALLQGQSDQCGSSSVSHLPLLDDPYIGPQLVPGLSLGRDICSYPARISPTFRTKCSTS